MRNQAKTKEAIKLYKQLLPIYEKDEDWKMAGLVLQMIGVSYKIDSDSGNAIHWLEKAKDLYKQHDLKEGYGNTLRDIGLVYIYTENFKS